MTSDEMPKDIPIEDMLEPLYEPVDFRCAIQIRNVPEKTNAGIVLPEEFKRKKLQESTEGLLIARGKNAFQDILDEVDRPQVGEMVQFVRYSGVVMKFPNNSEYVYKIVPDGDIGGRKREVNTDE
jgi:co-chaperonin GroES (HSP10)